VTLLNGNDVAELRQKLAAVKRDPAKADRRPRVTATWTGGDRSRVTASDTSIDVSGPGTLGPMELVLAALASCEIDVIATHATLMGVTIEDLSIEVTGEFNMQAYLAMQGSPPGFENVSYLVKLRAPSITDEQLARLAELTERASPVSSSLSRPVRLVGRIERI
jgi:uncharacterized OsmC-like protein